MLCSCRRAVACQGIVSRTVFDVRVLVLVGLLTYVMVSAQS